MKESYSHSGLQHSGCIRKETNMIAPVKWANDGRGNVVKLSYQTKPWTHSRARVRVRVRVIPVFIVRDTSCRFKVDGHTFLWKRINNKSLQTQLINKSIKQSVFSSLIIAQRRLLDKDNDKGPELTQAVFSSISLVKKTSSFECDTIKQREPSNVITVSAFPARKWHIMEPAGLHAST